MENFFQWIGYGFGGILSLLGIGKIVEICLSRFFKKQDASEQIHETNAGKIIDAEVIFKQSFIDRLTLVEARLDVVQKDLNSQMVENARLTEANKNLLATNERQEQEIITLRKINQTQAVEIGELKLEVDRLSKEVEEMRKT